VSYTGSWEPLVENFTNNGESIRDINEGSREKKKYPNHRSWGKNGEREKKMHAMCGSKDLYSRILGGSEKGSEGQTQLQYF
jgi:hypothetical protein